MLHFIEENKSITYFNIELWNEDDLSKQVYTEAGYKMNGNYLDINLEG
jgi:hypothetical protein